MSMVGKLSQGQVVTVGEGVTADFEVVAFGSDGRIAVLENDYFGMVGVALTECETVDDVKKAIENSYGSEWLPGPEEER